MSSNKYSSTLRPDPWLRIIVLSSGCILIAIGLVLILVLDMPAPVRLLGCIVWIGAGYRELRGLQGEFENLLAVRLSSDGSVEVLNGNQEWLAGEFLPGCIVLRNLAWLRLKGANGVQFVELMRGDSRVSQNWRRLQVIWRHIGAGR